MGISACWTAYWADRVPFDPKGFLVCCTRAGWRKVYPLPDFGCPACPTRWSPRDCEVLRGFGESRNATGEGKGAGARGQGRVRVTAPSL